MGGKTTMEPRGWVVQVDLCKWACIHSFTLSVLRSLCRRSTYMYGMASVDTCRLLLRRIAYSKADYIAYTTLHSPQAI